MARCGIKTRIVDKRGHKVYNGHADGLRPRTEEIFDSMGGNLQQRIEAEGYIFESFRTWVRLFFGRHPTIASTAKKWRRLHFTLFQHRQLTDNWNRSWVRMAR